MADSGSKNVDEPPKETSSGFSAQNISIQMQKKLISKFATKKTMKIFIDDTSSRIFDNVFRLINLYLDSKSQSQAMMKNIVKINMKLAVLYVNDVLNEAEKGYVYEFREKFHLIAERTTTNVLRPGSRAAKAGMDIEAMSALFKSCEDVILKTIQRHLTVKSQDKVRSSGAFFSDKDFLRFVFVKEGQPLPVKVLVHQIAEDLQELLDRGVL